MQFYLIFRKTWWIMHNSDPKELDHLPPSEIWQSQDVCKCVFDSIASAPPPHGNLLRGLPFLLAKPLTLEEFLFQILLSWGHTEMILFLANRQT
jgi:hypothetical protein